MKIADLSLNGINMSIKMNYLFDGVEFSLKHKSSNQNNLYLFSLGPRDFWDFLDYFWIFLEYFGFFWTFWIFWVFFGGDFWDFLGKFGISLI